MSLFERLTHLNPRSIRLKVPVLFMMVSVIPALVAMFSLSRLLTDRMEQILQQRVHDSAQIANNVFKSYSEELLLKARVITSSPQIAEELARGDKIALINQLSALNQDLGMNVYGAGIEIFDASGRLAVSEPKRAVQRIPDTMAYTVVKRGEFKISSYFQDDELIVSTAIPLFHARQATPVGVVGLSFAVSPKLADEIRKIAGAEVLFFIHPLGEQPRILATTLDESSGLELAQKYVSGSLKLQNRPEYLIASIKGSARNGEYELAAAVETRDMLNVIDSLRMLLFIVTGSALVLALIFSFGLSRSLVNKILYLVHAARKVEHGELDTEILLESDDEFGMLARNLDSMRLEIRSTLAEKETMIANLTVSDKINRAIVSQAGSELLKSVLMIILEAVEAQKGSIMMVDPESQTLVLKIVYDPDQALEPVNVDEHITFAIGEGIAGQVAATGEATICNDTQTEKRFKTYRFQEMDRRILNLACIPLKVGDSVLGVISLDNKIGGFQEKDQMLVQEMANQIAIAIQNAELYERSITDGLTGLYIRRYFEDLLDQEIRRSERSSKPVSLLMFDIDHFKRFNDTYGHQVGDWVIQEVATVAHDSIRDVDMAARYGGEEFAIIMPETHLDDAWLVGERIRKAVEESFVYHEGHKLKITISLGCAEFPSQANHKQVLIQHADTALYASKHQGRNQTTKYDPGLAMYERM